MAEDLRKSGIDIIGDVPWGTHFCQFFETGEDLLDILVPYFKTGLENNEFCMWVTAYPVAERDAERALRLVVPELDRYLESGQLEIMSHSDWYLKGGSFDSARVLNGWVDKLNNAMSRGFDGLRLTGNTFWLEKSDWRDFTAYEAAVDSVIGQYRIIAVCTYAAEKCGVAEVADVISNHRFALVKRHGGWETIESTERKRIEAALTESLKRRAIELDAVNKELEAFTYSVSHDLQAPLRTINGFSGVLLEDYGEKLDAQARDYLGRVRAASLRMARLIDDLLDLSRITRHEISREPVELSTLARDILSDLQKAEPERHVSFLVGPGLTAAGDRRLLQVALDNLLRNAWKFTGKIPAAQIEFGCTDCDGGPAFFVRDNGAGFDMAYADKLFGAFQRLHAVTEFPGNGIGLATVQRIVHRHGGRVWAEARLEQGATFFFTLPTLSPSV